MDWVSHTSKMRSAESHYVVSIPGPPCPWPSPGATVDFRWPWLSGFPILPAWWRWRLRATFSEYTQRSTGRGAGRGGLQQCFVDPQTVTLKGKGGRLTSSDWGEGLPFPQETSASWGSRVALSVSTEQEGDPPRLPTCLCFQEFSSFFGVSPQVF